MKPLSPAMRHALRMEARLWPHWTMLASRRAGTLRALERRGLVDRLRLTDRGLRVATQLAREETSP